MAEGSVQLKERFVRSIQACGGVSCKQTNKKTQGAEPNMTLVNVHESTQSTYGANKVGLKGSFPLLKQRHQRRTDLVHSWRLVVGEAKRESKRHETCLRTGGKYSSTCWPWITLLVIDLNNTYGSANEIILLSAWLKWRCCYHRRRTGSKRKIASLLVFRRSFQLGGQTKTSPGQIVTQSLELLRKKKKK